MVFPHLDRNDLYELNNAVNRPSDVIAASHLDFMVCPSDPQPTGSPTAYVYNTGMPGPSEPRGPGADNSANGVFTFRFVNRFTPPRGGIGGNYITDKDGTSQTVMLTENIDAGDWTDFREVDVGWVWHDSPAPAPPITINGRKGERGANNNLEWARPSSNHVQSVNVAFCDGHVRSLRQDIHYAVLVKLMTSFDRASGVDQNTPANNVNPRTSPPLNANDYE
jgi:prepilin-type processing-associated H-X9-DG protein